MGIVETIRPVKTVFAGIMTAAKKALEFTDPIPGVSSHRFFLSFRLCLCYKIQRYREGFESGRFAMRRVLFVCWGNSIRSQMAQAMLNYRGAGRFHAHSGGIRPADSVHPMTHQALIEAHIPAGRLRPKPWTRHLQEVDAVISLSASAREEIDEAWPQHANPPIRAHWEFADPIEIDAPGRVISESERFAFFQATRDELRECIEILAVAPRGEIQDDEAFRRLLQEIGRLE